MDKETYQRQKAFAGEKKSSMKRRLVGHDYTRPGIYMLTMTIEGRRPLFGRVYGSEDNVQIELTPLGNAVRDEWWGIPNHHPEIKVFELQMMPDHLHGILYVCKPIKGGLSRVVRGFKTGCGRHYRELIEPLEVATESQQTVKGQKMKGLASQLVATLSQQAIKGQKGKDTHPKHGLLFEPGFNDLILRSNDEYQHWKRYLRDNPRRLLMKRLHPTLLHPFFHWKIGSWTYNGIGNRQLLAVSWRKNVRISRRLSSQQLEAEVAGYIADAKAGCVLISPAISPGEKRVMRTVFDMGLPTVVVLRNGFTPLSKPHGEQFYACSKGRLLMLSTWPHTNERITLTAHDCQQMNLQAQELSRLEIDTSIPVTAKP